MKPMGSNVHEEWKTVNRSDSTLASRQLPKIWQPKRSTDCYRVESSRVLHRASDCRRTPVKDTALHVLVKEKNSVFMVNHGLAERSPAQTKMPCRPYRALSFIPRKSKSVLCAFCTA